MNASTGRTLRERADGAGGEGIMVMLVLIGWAVLSVLGVVGATAVCRAGHVEDVARGFVEPEVTRR